MYYAKALLIVCWHKRPTMKTEKKCILPTAPAVSEFQGVRRGKSKQTKLYGFRRKHE